MAADAWTLGKLRLELDRFEGELRAKGLEESTIRTYVDRSAIFVRWLAGDYHPVGPNGRRS